MLYHSLKEDFGVPQVAARLWGKVPEQSYLPELAATSAEVRDYADQLGAAVLRAAAPRSSRATGSRTASSLASFAFLPLRTAHTFGVLALGEPRSASASTRAWAPCTSTRLAELASVATARFLPAS